MTTYPNNALLKKSGKETGIFYFKQFKVEDGRSTMKVGTDAVLFGAAAEIEDAEEILEIGTGCGVIALILAQRSPARIDAIEIDEESVSQAMENVIKSPWKGRINIIHSSLQDFINHTEKRYDLIISNPPYFSRSLKSDDRKRNISRHNDSLCFNELADGASLLMNPGASFWVILPVKESEEFIDAAVKYGLCVHSCIKIIPKAGKANHRMILHFKKSSEEKVEEKTITIKNADGSYSFDYMEVTKDFYIDF